MSEQLLSDVDAEPSENGWNSFEVWKTTIHDTRAQRIGRSWADYMDDLEDQQLLQRLKLQRLVKKALLFTALALVLYLYFQLR